MKGNTMADSSAALNSKVAALEDEMRIIKGEVKQVLTEIRSAILVQDSPFEESPTRARPVQIVPAVEPARVEIVMPHVEEPAPTAKPVVLAEPPHTEPAHMELSRQDAHPEPNTPPHQLHATQPQVAQHGAPLQHAPVPHQARWSLLTIANLAAWAEEAFQRLGGLRLAILLDLCEVSGYLSPEARLALARVSDLDIPSPEQPASPMEVTVMLRQLDALLQGEASDLGPRLLY
jgi:hypothetical protein